MPEEEFYPMLVTNNGNYYEIDEEKNVTYIDDSEVFTITKIYDDDTTETQFVRKGNNYGLISYKKREGELFVGWSNTPDTLNSSTVINFSDVSEDMTVYANYISDDYAQVYQYFIYNNSTKKITNYYIITAVPGAAMLSITNSIKVDMSYKGITTECERYSLSNSFNITSADGTTTLTSTSIFGVPGTLAVYKIPISEFCEGTEITFSPYFVTKDGAKIEGTEKTVIWHEYYQENS